MREIDNNSNLTKYKCICDWPDDCFVQGGSSGIVLSKNGNYTTSYFEAFPNNPKCFIRGEGQTLEDAEKECFNKFKQYTSCKEHDFIRSEGYHNGMGTCTKCGLMTIVFKPDYKCVCCGKDNIKAYTSILPKYKVNETDSICKNCAKSKDGFKYLSGLEIHSLCNHFNGINLIYPIIDKKTFDILLTKPNTLEDFLDICSKDSNIYLEESMKRMLLDRDETELQFPSLSPKVNNYDELYNYFYDNYMKRWIENGFRSKN